MKQLEDFYSGDDVWLMNVEIAKQGWVDSELQRSLLAKVNDDFPLAAMIYARLGDYCLEWLDTRVPALAGRKPINCLGSDSLIRRLKEALMRMEP